LAELPDLSMKKDFEFRDLVAGMMEDNKQSRESPEYLNRNNSEFHCRL
jgi:hypothetical protein